jgi:hypothetical protein
MGHIPVWPMTLMDSVSIVCHFYEERIDLASLPARLKRLTT